MLIVLMFVVVAVAVVVRVGLILSGRAARRDRGRVAAPRRGGRGYGADANKMLWADAGLTADHHNHHHGHGHHHGGYDGGGHHSGHHDGGSSWSGSGSGDFGGGHHHG